MNVDYFVSFEFSAAGYQHKLLWIMSSPFISDYYFKITGRVSQYYTTTAIKERWTNSKSTKLLHELIFIISWWSNYKNKFSTFFPWKLFIMFIFPKNLNFQIIHIIYSMHVSSSAWVKFCSYYSLFLDINVWCCPLAFHSKLCSFEWNETGNTVTVFLIL